MQAFLLVGAGGALGAMGRYGLGVFVGRYWHGVLPMGVMLANIVGSFAMGLLVGLLAHFTPDWQNETRLFLAVGLLGGFTTFSSFSLEVITLFERGHIALALVYIGLSVIVSVTMLFAGLALVRGVL